MPPASSSAGTGRLESGARASGSGRATMARRSGSPPPSTPWNASARTPPHDRRRRRSGEHAVNSAIAGAVLASLAAGGLAYVFVYPLLSGDARAEKRQKALVDSAPERRVDRASAVNRRDQVAQSLKDLEARQKARHKITTEARITQAGLAWTKQRFFIISACIGLLLGLTLFVVSGSSYVALSGVF